MATLPQPWTTHTEDAPTRRGRPLLGVLSTVLVRLSMVAVVTLAGAVIAVPMLMNWIPLNVLSGSMEPTIPTGSQVVVEPIAGEADARKLEVGDIVTVMPYPGDPTLVTHRIVSKAASPDGLRFETAGDATGAIDPWDVTATQLRGLVRYHLPYVGYVATTGDQDTRETARWVVGGGVIAVGLLRLLPRRRRRSTTSTRPHGRRRQHAHP